VRVVVGCFTSVRWVPIPIMVKYISWQRGGRKLEGGYVLVEIEYHGDVSA